MLSAHEAPAFTVERPESECPLLFTCDHAHWRVPEALGSLGLPSDELRRHIGWDIGALAVAQRLAAHFGATLVASGYSRLVVDCNRHPERHDAMPVKSEATDIPGNRDLDAAARAARVAAFHAPYHAAITALLDARAARGRAVVYVAIHSFTPVYLGVARPWQVGLLSNRDRRLTEPLLAALRADPTLCVGDNVPYRVTDEGDYGIPVHAEARGLPNVLIELRQDEIAEPCGQQRWAARLAALLPTAVAEAGIGALGATTEPRDRP